jgi:hypothetical protein
MHTSNHPYHLCVAQLSVHALVQQIPAGLVIHFNWPATAAVVGDLHLADKD